MPDEVKALSPRERRLLDNVMKAHPRLTIAEALTALRETGAVVAMPPGPPPIPISLRVLRGNPSKRRLPREPEPTREVSPRTLCRLNGPQSLRFITGSLHSIVI
jgi:hypothetical protein